MRVEYSETARKQLKKLPKFTQIKVLRKIELLKTSPTTGKKLKGEFAGLRAFRAWPYRIIYRYNHREKRLFIHVIQHRQSVYK